MKPSTTAQRAAIGAIASRLGLTKDAKGALVSSYSNGRTDSSTGLYFEEAAALIKGLTPGPSPHGEGSRKRVAAEEKAKGEKMRRQVIAIFHEMGAHTPQPPEGGAQRPKIDMARVNQWCTTQGHGHKPLNDYTFEELPKLVGQAKKYLEWYMAKL